MNRLIVTGVLMIINLSSEILLPLKTKDILLFFFPAAVWFADNAASGDDILRRTELIKECKMKRSHFCIHKTPCSLQTSATV
jgi:hypothetical protein